VQRRYLFAESFDFFAGTRMRYVPDEELQTTQLHQPKSEYFNARLQSHHREGPARRVWYDGHSRRVVAYLGSIRWQTHGVFVAIPFGILSNLGVLHESKRQASSVKPDKQTCQASVNRHCTNTQSIPRGFPKKQRSHLAPPYRRPPLSPHLQTVPSAPSLRRPEHLPNDHG
jgi:hypothetical protein